MRALFARGLLFLFEHPSGDGEQEGAFLVGHRRVNLPGLMTCLAMRSARDWLSEARVRLSAKEAEARA